ncbi:hypothetical protein DL96DRAFT_1642683 [Flagelloscypha sp. PMI_526]|nr:hypothetical protein DL96DRAFT_1642683 [Flagelloscypha sp. PMI_526]
MPLGDLSPDLLRLIIDQAVGDRTDGTLDVKTACQLTLVSREIQSWVDQKLFRYVELDSNFFPERLLDHLNTTQRLSERMTKALTYVRFMVAGLRWSIGWPKNTFLAPQLLQAANLHSFVHLSSLPFPPSATTPSVSQNLKFLAIDLGIFEDMGETLFAHPVFQPISTLVVLDGWESWTSSDKLDWRGLKNLKNLRCLVLDASRCNQSIVSPLTQYILPHLPETLSVLAIVVDNSYGFDNKGINEEFRRLMYGEIHPKVIVQTDRSGPNKLPEWVLDVSDYDDDTRKEWYMDVPESATTKFRALSALQLRNKCIGKVNA